MSEPLLIAVLGIDGCGKSTVLAGLRTEFERLELPVREFHLRPNFQRKRGVKTASPPDHDAPPRGILTSAMKAALFATDYLASRWSRFGTDPERPGVVLFDRYMSDLLADPKRYRYGGWLWLWRLACHAAPRPAMTIVLDVPGAVAVERKGELSLPMANKLRTSYLSLAERYGWTVIDATKPPKEIVKTILKSLAEGGHLTLDPSRAR